MNRTSKEKQPGMKRLTGILIIDFVVAVVVAGCVLYFFTRLLFDESARNPTAELNTSIGNKATGMQQQNASTESKTIEVNQKQLKEEILQELQRVSFQRNLMATLDAVIGTAVSAREIELTSKTTIDAPTDNVFAVNDLADLRSDFNDDNKFKKFASNLRSELREIFSDTNQNVTIKKANDIQEKAKNTKKELIEMAEGKQATATALRCSKAIAVASTLSQLEVNVHIFLPKLSLPVLVNDDPKATKSKLINASFKPFRKKSDEKANADTNVSEDFPLVYKKFTDKDDEVVIAVCLSFKYFNPVLIKIPAPMLDFKLEQEITCRRVFEGGMDFETGVPILGYNPDHPASFYRMPNFTVTLGDSTYGFRATRVPENALFNGDLHPVVYDADEIWSFTNGACIKKFPVQ